MNFKEIKKELFKRELNSKTLPLMYLIIVILLLGIFIQNIILAVGGIRIANALGHVADTEMNQTKMISILIKESRDPLFQFAKEDAKRNEKKKR